MSVKRVVVLQGDGIGPEITSSALAVLRAVVDVWIEEHPFGGVSIEQYGIPLPDSTLSACLSADAVLLACVGGPQWDSTDAEAIRPEQGLLKLRQRMGLYANLRPVTRWGELNIDGPFLPKHVNGTNMVIVRELTGGIYYGQRERVGDTAYDTCSYTTQEIERIARIAFELARSRRGRVTSVDKANVLDTSRLWREVVIRVQADEFQDVELEHILVDACAMLLVAEPTRFDVLLTENLFGDILSDEASVLSGSVGMLPSASIGDLSHPGLFEPAHGSAPQIAGTGTANPCAMILSVAMLLRLGLKCPAEADRVEAAVRRTLEAGVLTPDLGGSATTLEMTECVLAALARS